MGPSADCTVLPTEPESGVDLFGEMFDGVPYRSRDKAEQFGGAVHGSTGYNPGLDGGDPGARLGGVHVRRRRKQLRLLPDGLAVAHVPGLDSKCHLQVTEHRRCWSEATGRLGWRAGGEGWAALSSYATG